MRTAAPATGPGRPAASTRRERRVFYLFGLVFMLSTTAIAALSTLLASRLDVRWDVTAFQEHALSERTRSIVTSLEVPHEVVVATEWSALSPHVRDRVAGAIERVADASANLSSTFIDTASASGEERYRALIDRLIERDREAIEGQRREIRAAMDELGSLESLFAELATSLETLSRELARGNARARGTASSFTGLASAAMRAPSQVREVATMVERDLARAESASGLPALDEARVRLVSVMEGLGRQFAELGSQVEELAGWSAAPDAARSLARDLAPRLERQRDRAATWADDLRRLERPDALRIAGVLSQSGAALVIGPPEAGVTAIDLAALFPQAELAGKESAVVLADLPRRAEELLGTALAALGSPERPIVILVHAHARRFTDEMLVFRGLLDRLRLRGIDIAEWRVTVDEAEPELTELDPAGVRPRCYVAIGNDTVVEGQAGIERASELAEALGRLADRGENMLLSAVPSALPTFGSEDPVVGFLDRFGLDVRTGEVVLELAREQGGRTVLTEQRLTPAAGEHPISETVSGLATVLNWPVPISIEPVEASPGERVSQWPLIEVGGGGVWTTREWTTLWQARGDRGSIPDPPRPPADAGRGREPITVAAAAERSAPGLLAPQRVVVVGSFDWFFDRWTQEGQVVDGVPTYRNPGNLELFEAAMYWLAGQDHMVAASPTARPVALIRPLDERTLTALRWAIAVGPPVLVLLLGGAWRLLRG